MTQNNKVSPTAKPTTTPVAPSAPVHASSQANTFYFCIPQNDELLAYWDTVADRLFKIRNCMNIEGVVRQLPLFAPPIDPALLVRAAAMGVDISSALNDMNAATPYYRFTYMIQKALELCADIKALGGALLAALEKKDAEAMASLRAGQETSVLRAVKDVKTKQIEEAKNTLDGLNKYREVVRTRLLYYQNIVNISGQEQAYMDGLSTAHVFNETSQGLAAGVSAVHVLPDAVFGGAGMSSPVSLASWGGSSLGSAMSAAAGVLGMIAAQYTHDATMASIKGGYDRRWDDWKQQEKLASKEIGQVEAQIAAAEIRAAITQLELDNHNQQIDNASSVEEFLRNKYTSQELYSWTVEQVSKVFFQSYKLAYDLAKRAERAFRFERGLATSDYIQFGYWDSSRKGFLAGEQLYLDLKRMEMKYLDQNKRDYEITKHLSLMLNDPIALITLKETGQCTTKLLEALFDADYPGHYVRRIKSVSLTIPCVTGPYTSINCTLTLLTNSTRVNSKPTVSDDTYIDNFSAIESIATSHAQNDSGMFELNFRDERYLPFEGAGAISTWRIEMPKDTNAFDFETISDVILNLNYTARDGGKPLQAAVKSAAKQSANGDPVVLFRMFSLKHEFPTDWYRFLRPVDTAPSQTMTMALTMERFPFQLRGKGIRIALVELFLKFKDIGDYASGTALTLSITPPDPGTPMRNSLQIGKLGLPLAQFDFTTGSPVGFGNWALGADNGDIQKIKLSLQNQVTVAGKVYYHLKPEVIDDIVMVCHYSPGQ